jgi:ATP-binding cassette subfamily A (ABC1) protein 3
VITQPFLLKQKEENKHLQIKNISKYYGEFQAINDLSLELYNGQIFALLGHNGAGKTSLIKIISGTEEAQNGDILLNGHSLLSDKEFLYKTIGLCSQDDILFQDLTVEEQLNLMCTLQGGDNSRVKELLIEIELIDKSKELAKNLSGGQKRKLCVALALCGDSKLVLLDEPTSGMDSIAKKGFWKFLKKYKDDKIIILTTHSLEEADYLGDRIGIMNEGQLACLGTSTYLKNQYSCGFNINLMIDKEKQNKRDRTNLINELREVQPDLTVRVLGKETISINFPSLGESIEPTFRRIRDLQGMYLISNYTVSTTSLEDVFLRLNDHNFSNKLYKKKLKAENTDLKIQHPQRDILLETHDQDLNNDSFNKYRIKPKQMVLKRQVLPLLKRHFLELRRNYISHFVQWIFAIFPLIFYVLFFYPKNEMIIPYGNLLQDGKLYYEIKGSNISYFATYDEFTPNWILHNTNLTSKDIQIYNKYIYDSFPYYDIKSFSKIDISDQFLNATIFYSPSSIPIKTSQNNIILSSYLRNEFGIETKIIVKLIIYYYRFILKRMAMYKLIPLSTLL